jgi:hypothetical protein
MTDLVDGFGRHMDIGRMDWMHTGPAYEQLWVISCRHGTTRSHESDGGSEGEVMSRLFEEHRRNVNASEQSYRGHWLCFCEPHRGTA